MNIIYSEQENTFHLYNDDISYIFQIVKQKYLMHCYYGKRILYYHESNKNWLYDRGFCSNPDEKDTTFSLDTILREFPDFNQGDYRTPAYRIQSDDGDEVTRFLYKSHCIFGGKKMPEGLPAVYCESKDEAMTLEITLTDEVRRMDVVLYYTIYRDYPVITRFAVVRNNGKDSVLLKKIMSMNLDILDSRWDVLTLTGAHVNEKNVQRRRISSDTILIESSRGTSSPQSTPFIGLVRQNTTEDTGEAIGINLIYSGNFECKVQKSQYGTVRTQMGINEATFDWKLESGEKFCTPEAVIVYSSKGMQKMSQTFHKLYRTRVCRGFWRDRVRPVLLNSWEAMYFDVSEEKVLALAKQASELGIETFVLDDGWFQNRHADNAALGDWMIDKEKFPRGLKFLGAKIEEMKLGFGIWFEPEMISEKSKLYEQHPEWVIKSSRYCPTASRSQYVLDLSNPEVCEYLVESISNILEEGQITYVKWDMNRHLSDLYSKYLGKDRQGEVSHRYILGLYQILNDLNIRFPKVLFEGCSSGGGRFDAGMLYYMPQTWTSDNSDAIARLKIQQGTSMLFPPITMGSHVSDIPNHQVGRYTPLKTRFHVAMSGNLGYELDLNKLDESQKNEIKEQIEFYKKIRETVQLGNYYRLADSFHENCGAWQFVSEDGMEILVVYVQVLAQAAYEVPVIYLQGLEKEALYEESNSGIVFGGDELMYAGMTIPRRLSDFVSDLYHFKRIK